MKMLLLGGNTGFWQSSSWSPQDRSVMSGIESWVFAFDGDYVNTLDATPELIAKYDLIIGNTNRGDYLPKLLELQSSRKSHTKWVSLIEACATEYLAIDDDFKVLLDGSDLVNVINRFSLALFREMTTTRCEYIGIPYDAEGIRAQFRAGPRRDVWTPSNMYNPRPSNVSVIVSLPITEREGVKTHKAYRPVPKKRKLFAMRSRANTLEHPKQDWLLKPVEMHPESNFRGYFETLTNTAYAFVNLDHRYTWARDVLDCAAMQIPCIATRSTGHVLDYFPDLMVENEFAVLPARELLDRLYRDKDFYQTCARIPLEMLEPLSHKSMREKLLRFL